MKLVPTSKYSSPILFEISDIVIGKANNPPEANRIIEEPSIIVLSICRAASIKIMQAILKIIFRKILLSDIDKLDYCQLARESYE